VQALFIASDWMIAFSDTKVDDFASSQSDLPESCGMPEGKKQV
jgi:hypothetical protein